jgi:hypothetical protein
MRTNILLKKLLGTVLCIPLFACGSGDNINYVSRDLLDTDPLYQQGRSDMEKPTNYGALKYQEQDDSDNQGKLFVIQKKKKVYQLETMFKQNEHKKYYFAVGMDYKNQSPHVSFRVEF